MNNLEKPDKEVTEQIEAYKKILRRLWVWKTYPMLMLSVPAVKWSPVSRL